jgi:hypothetical protein
MLMIVSLACRSNLPVQMLARTLRGSIMKKLAPAMIPRQANVFVSIVSGTPCGLRSGMEQLQVPPFVISRPFDP